MMIQVGINFSEVVLPLLAVAIGIYFNSPAFTLASMIVFSTIHLLCYAAINERMPKVRFVPVFPIVQSISTALFLFFFDNLPTPFVVISIVVLAATYLLIFIGGVKAAKKLNEKFNINTVILLRILMCLAGMISAAIALMKGMAAAAIALLIIAALPFPHLAIFLEDGGDGVASDNNPE